MKQLEVTSFDNSTFRIRCLDMQHKSYLDGYVLGIIFRVGSMNELRTGTSDKTSDVELYI